VTFLHRLRGALGVRAAAALTCALVTIALPARALALSPPKLDVKAAALIEARTGTQLYGMNARAELPIASATKLMTALVVLEHARLGEVFAAPAYTLAAVDSQIGLEAGQRMDVADLIAAMMLPSADDAAHDLAENVGGGSVDRFVAMMNSRAAQLGLTRTHYSTPVGLDTPGNYSSASDLVVLARYALRTQPFLRHLVAMPTAKLRIGNQTRIVTNLNGLVGRVSWLNGVKTGHTLAAGYVLVGSGTRGGTTMISAVLDASSESAREADTLALLKWGFDNFRRASPVRAGQVVIRVPVRGRQGFRAALLAAGSFTRVVPKSVPVTTMLRVPRELRGPLHRGAVAGSEVVLEGGVAVARIPLRLARAVPAPPRGVSPTTILGPFTLVVLVLLLGVAVVKGRRERLTARRVAGQRQE